MHARPMSKMQMMTYIQTHTLPMYKQTTVNVKQKCKAVRERKNKSVLWPVATLGFPPKKRICLTSSARRINVLQIDLFGSYS